MEDPVFAEIVDSRCWLPLLEYKLSQYQYAPSLNLPDDIILQITKLTEDIDPRIITKLTMICRRAYKTIHMELLRVFLETRKASHVPGEIVNMPEITDSCFSVPSLLHEKYDLNQQLFSIYMCYGSELGGGIDKKSYDRPLTFRHRYYWQALRVKLQYTGKKESWHDDKLDGYYHHYKIWYTDNSNKTTPGTSFFDSPKYAGYIDQWERFCNIITVRPRIGSHTVNHSIVKAL